MSLATWTIKQYDLDGNFVQTLQNAGSRGLNFPLNGIDSCQFALDLTDPQASSIRTLKSIIKVWRDFDDPLYSKTLASDPGFPVFGGVVTDTDKQGEANQMVVTAQSPFWRLQLRFHLLNHRLGFTVFFGVSTPSPTGPFNLTYSYLLWKVIDLVNNAFGLSLSDTGIALGTDIDSDTGIIELYSIPKGSNTWNHISTLVAEVGAPDLHPVYVHADGDPTIMEFNTAYPALGTDRTGSVSFDYNTAGFTLEDCQEREFASPDQFANFIRSYGQGSKISFSRDDFVTALDEFSPENVGIYMREDKYDEVFTADGLAAKGQAAIGRSGHPTLVYNLKCTPVKPPVYGIDFFLGDKCKLNADKGALQVSDKTQRIYNVKLMMSDENEESTEVLVADDFLDAVPSA